MRNVYGIISKIFRFPMCACILVGQCEGMTNGYSSIIISFPENQSRSCRSRFHGYAWTPKFAGTCAGASYELEKFASVAYIPCAAAALLEAASFASRLCRCRSCARLARK
jgi:hypothetical protein